MHFRPLAPAALTRLLAGALALAVASCAPAVQNTDPALATLIQRLGQSELSHSPEQADVLGIAPDVFGRPYAADLDERSIAAAERARITRLDSLHALETVDRTTLSADAIRQLDTALYAYASATRLDRYGYGYVSLGWASPYLINQSDGAYTDLIKFLTIHHPIQSRADAEAWLTRLAKVDDAIDDERRRFEIDIEAGDTPPRAILQRTLEKAHSLQPATAREHRLTLYFAEAVSQISDLPEADMRRMIDDAAKIVGDDITPAYTRLIKVLDKALVKASDDPGVWRLRDGDGYYQDALRLYTTTDMSPKQIHAIGEKLVTDLTAQMDKVLIELGRTEGTVGERMQAMSIDPLYLYPDTPEGQDALLVAVAEQVKWGETRLSRLVTVGPKSKVEIRRAPQISQDTAPGAYYKAAALDGSRPPTYNLNLRSTLDWPMWSLPTLTFHESVPGHQLQAGLARDRPNQPVLNFMISNPAFNEGWAVYAEDLAAELGVYDTDPAGRLGYLQSLLFRAARLVADTGMHSEHWGREQTVQYMMTTTGLSRAAMENEVDRYTIWPGQACAYMIGREKIRRLRDGADKSLGPDFDLRAFHDVILAGGGRPLGVLETDIQEWIRSRKPAAPAPQ